MDPDAGEPPAGDQFLTVERDWVRVEAGSSSEAPIVTLYAGGDPGPQAGWEDVEEITMVSTTGFLALCDGGYNPVHKANLATAGTGTYVIRVHASDRSSEDKKPRFLIQVIPGQRTGAEPAPPSATIEDSEGPLLVRTSFTQPQEWARLLDALDEAAQKHHAPLTVIDNPAYTGHTPAQITARIQRDDEGWPATTLVLIADEQALASAEYPVLAVNNLPDDDDAPFRITLAAASSLVVNMELSNTDFREWVQGVDADGIYREEHY
ncbi:DUF6924 domain-containing protein [Streptomyces buecherae]|uniref:DUF6924 domain-containing protein n=1 Tax=Streptomyces buecherae TaxID=2763006 RepID=A0A7H8N1J0_9ACTN|nr:hypothetical protein [Streptomyces buecherae]QKW48272.1 hypothetical protein HUT08_00500 [Streptomyces buecherae]